MNAKRILRACALSPVYLALSFIFFVVSVPVGLVGTIYHQILFDGEDTLENAIFQHAGCIPFIGGCYYAAQAVEVWRFEPRTAKVSPG